MTIENGVLLVRETSILASGSISDNRFPWRIETKAEIVLFPTKWLFNRGQLEVTVFPSMISDGEMKLSTEDDKL